MPELPEVEAAMEFLRKRASGRTITRMRLLHPALQRRLTAAQLKALAGARIVRVERRGKHQLLHLDDGRVLHAHFRMNGDWALVGGGEELPRFARAVIDFDDGQSLVFVDSRALGTMDLHSAGADLDLGLGPDAADPDWTAEQLGRALAPRRGPIKPALLDQRLVAGLGNIYAAESLWRARISPHASCAALAPEQVGVLRRAIAAVIERATGSRYTDDDTVALDVYDREGQPCRRCGTAIERVVQAGRSTFFCPRCQPDVGGKAPSKPNATKASKSRSAAKSKRSKTAKPAKVARTAGSVKTVKTTKPAKKVKPAKNANVVERSTRASAARPRSAPKRSTR